jgi:hypothetical protein
MTDQRDPLRRRPAMSIRRDDGSWGMLPILAAIAVVALVGYMLFGDNFRGPNATTANRTDGPTTTTPKTTPAPPATSPTQK